MCAGAGTVYGGFENWTANEHVHHSHNCLSVPEPQWSTQFNFYLFFVCTQYLFIFWPLGQLVACIPPPIQ